MRPVLTVSPGCGESLERDVQSVPDSSEESEWTERSEGSDARRNFDFGAGKD